MPPARADRVQWFGRETVALDDDLLFATGDHRLCYRHPHRADLCIKLTRTGKAKELKRTAPFYKRLRSERSFDDNWREYRAYRQPALRSADASLWECLPRCHGWVETTRGTGLVSDYFGDQLDRPAETLEHHLEANGLTAEIAGCIDAFIDYLRRTLVITKNLLPHNLLVDYRQRQSPRLVLIDGLGLASLIPLPLYSRYFARRHVERRIARLRVRIDWELGGRVQPWLDVERRAAR